MKQLFFIILLIVFKYNNAIESNKLIQQKIIKNTKFCVKVKKHRVVISFLSKGAGTDYKLKTLVENYISSHPKKPINKIIFWGREGENDFCFSLKELNRLEQVEFVSEIKKIVGCSDLVIITENTINNHQERK